MRDRDERKNSSSKQSRKAPPGICANVNDDLLSLQKVSLFVCLSAGAATVCVCVSCACEGWRCFAFTTLLWYLVLILRAASCLFCLLA